MVNAVLYDHLQPLIMPQQHGFMGNRSVASNLAEFMDHVKTKMAHGDQVDVIFVDFSKAFDQVQYGKVGKGFASSWSTFNCKKVD